MYSQGHTEDSDTGGQAGNIHKSLSIRDKKDASIRVKVLYAIPPKKSANVIIVSSECICCKVHEL